MYEFDTNRATVTPEMLATRAGMKRTGNEWHGPNPSGEGATTDGYILNDDGTSYDRKSGKRYTSIGTAKLHGIDPDDYQPVAEHRASKPTKASSSVKRASVPKKIAAKADKPKAPKSKPTPKTPKQRGITPEILAQFKVRTVRGDQPNREGLVYPTHHADGKEGRPRFKNARAANDGELKYQWFNGGNGQQPDVYNLHTIPEGAPEVWAVGGEPDVWVMTQNGFVAVCTFGETQKPALLVAAMKAKRVGVLKILLDNDEAGRTGAAAIESECQKQDQPYTVRQFDGPEGFDVCDQFAACEFDREKFRAAIITLPEVSYTACNPCNPCNPRNPRNRVTGGNALDLLDTEFTPIKWAVEGIIPEGLAILGGHPKLGKSWAMLGTAIAVVTGGRAFGQIEVQSGSALYMALEDTSRRMKARLQQMLAGERPEGLQNLHIEYEWPRSNEGGLQKLDDWLSEHPDARLVVIDTLQKIKPRRRAGGSIYESDSDDVGDLKSIADRHAVAIVCVHHLRKGDGDDDPVEMLSGSYGLSGAADTLLILKRTRGQADATLFVTGRDVDDDKEHALRFDRDLAQWNLLGDAAEYNLTAGRKQVIDALRTMPEPVTPAQLWERTQVGKSANNLKTLLWRMSVAGEIKTADGKYWVTPVTPVTPVTEVTEVTDKSKPNTQTTRTAKARAESEPYQTNE